MARGIFNSGGVYSSPAFQIGMALGNAYGTMWATNAKKRQTEQADNIIADMTGGNGGEGNSDAAQIAEIAAMGNNANNGMAANTVTPGAGALTPRQQQLTNDVVMGGASPQQIAASITGNIPGTEGNNIDAALNRIQQQEQIRQLGNIGSANANPLFSVDDFVRRAKEAGLNDEVINARLPELQREAARRARETLLPGITDNLYGYTNADGVAVPPNYAQAFEDILRLREYDPETAKVLMSGMVSPADLYNTQQKNADRIANDESYARRREIDAEAKERELRARAEQLARYNGMSYNEAMRYILGGTRGGSGSRTGTQKSLLSSEDFKYANDQLAAYDERISMGETLTPAEQADYNRLYNYKQQALNATYGGGNLPQANVNNAEGQLFAMADAAREQGMTDEEILADLRTQLGTLGYDENSSLYRAVVEHLGAGGGSNNNTSARPQQTSTEQQQEAAPAPAPEPTSPMLVQDSNGLPHWLNELGSEGVLRLGARIGELNRGSNGLPYFWQNNG
ncbi:MAG: hypothetical protein DBY32_04140 [Phascolarctobacterium sp.]|nr:MAG: hypothetical protein DBY32_04140 [Phascolarctobacterium sp.]